MSEYNRSKFLLFINNNNNLLLLKKYKKFINCNTSDDFLNNMKITKEDIIKLYKLLDNENIITIKENTLNLFSAKCFDNFEKDYKGTLSTTTNLLKNKVINTDPHNVSLINNYFNCIEPNKYKRLIVFKNKYELTLLNFVSDNYSGRVFYRYIFTKIILGDDFNTEDIINNTSYSGFYKDGTLGQEIIYYFLEIYNYDRYNYLKTFINDYQTVSVSDIHNNESIIINELLRNNFFKKIYPPIDGIIYLDTNVDYTSSSLERQYGLETVIYIPEIILKIETNIYPTTSDTFIHSLEKPSESNYVVKDINMKALTEYLLSNKFIEPLDSPKLIYVGGGNNLYYKLKYLKYKSKYLNLLNK